MIVLSKEEYLNFNKNVVGASRRFYNVAKHSVLPSNTSDAVINIGRYLLDDFAFLDSVTHKEKCEELIKKGFVTVSFFKGIVDCCFTVGTKVLMRNGEYKNVEDLKVGDLLMTTLDIEPLQHVAEVKCVLHSDIDYDPEEDYDVYFVDVVTSKNYEMNDIFIKSDKYEK